MTSDKNICYYEENDKSGGIPMADEKVIKTRSYRIDQETEEKIKRIAEEIGGSQQEAFARLVEVYELQATKLSMPGRANTIDTFQEYQGKLTNMFTQLLIENQDAEDRIRTNYEAELRSKDQTIIDLQAAAKAAKEQAEEAKNRMQEAQTAEQKARDMIAEKETEIKRLTESMEDKERLNALAIKANTDLESKVSAMEQSAARADADAKEVIRLRTELIKAQDALKAAENHEIEEIRKQTEKSAMAQEKALLELEKVHQEEIKKIQSEVDLYREKLLDALEQVKIIINK